MIFRFAVVAPQFHVSRPPTIAAWCGRSMRAPGPKTLMNLAAANLSIGAGHQSRSSSGSIAFPFSSISRRLQQVSTSAERAVRLELCRLLSSRSKSDRADNAAGTARTVVVLLVSEAWLPSPSVACKSLPNRRAGLPLCPGRRRGVAAYPCCPVRHICSTLRPKISTTGERLDRSSMARIALGPLVIPGQPWRLSATVTSASPRSRARGENGVTLVASTER